MATRDATRTITSVNCENIRRTWTSMSCATVFPPGLTCAEQHKTSLPDETFLTAFCFSCRLRLPRTWSYQDRMARPWKWSHSAQICPPGKVTKHYWQHTSLQLTSHEYGILTYYYLALCGIQNCIIKAFQDYPGISYFSLTYSLLSHLSVKNKEGIWAIILTNTGEPYMDTLKRGLLLANADGCGCPWLMSPDSLNKDLLLVLPSARMLLRSGKK